MLRDLINSMKIVVTPSTKTLKFNVLGIEPSEEECDTIDMMINESCDDTSVLFHHIVEKDTIEFVYERPIDDDVVIAKTKELLDKIDTATDDVLKHIKTMIQKIDIDKVDHEDLRDQIRGINKFTIDDQHMNIMDTIELDGILAPYSNEATEMIRSYLEKEIAKLDSDKVSVFYGKSHEPTYDMIYFIFREKEMTIKDYIVILERFLDDENQSNNEAKSIVERILMDIEDGN